MKSRLVFGTLLACTVALSMLAQEGSGPQPPAIESFMAPGSSNTSAIPAILATEPQVPLGPRDILNNYEQEMASVSQRTYADLVAIADAVRQGHISREQAEFFSTERYQLGMMQFQLLSTLHESLETDVEKADAKQAQPRAPDDSVLASPPVASHEVPQAVINYLELTPPQVAAIQAQTAEERGRLESLVEQLVKIRRELISATSKGRFDSKQVTHLADEQSRIVKQFIVASARLQAKVYSILTTDQQRKFGELSDQITASVKPSFADW